MRGITLVAAGTFIAAAATTAAAQTGAVPAPPPPAPAPAPRAPQPPRVIERRVIIRSDSAWRNRPTLGVSLEPTGSARDTLGVFITHVVPGGPAERAGIIEGDRIAAIGSLSLRLDRVDLGDSYAEGLPAHRLERAVARLAPGSSVVLRVFANGRYRDVTVKPARFADVYKGAHGPYLGMMHGMLPRLEMLGAAMGDGADHAMQAVHPELDLEITRAMHAAPRTVRISVDSAP